MATRPETRTRVESIKSDFDVAAELIRSDTSRTHDYIVSEIADRYVTAQRQIADLVDADNGIDANRQRTLYARTFGIDGLPGDKASLTISRRDAGDRAEVLSYERDAQVLLDRAERTGDETLARAIAERAYDQRWVNTLNSYLESHPTADGDVNELWASREQTNWREDFSARVLNDVPRPPELSGMSDFEIQKVANGRPSTNTTIYSRG